MKANLYRVIVPVSNIEQAASFYSILLEQPGTRVSPGRHYFNLEGTILACFDPQADGDGFEARPNPEYIYIAVDALEELFARAQTAGCQELDADIELQPWGERCFYAKDPFGNPLCFVDENTLFLGQAHEDH